MAERGNLQATLNAGIDAVHAGDRATAKKLLQQVIRADPGNEVAWMWMASAVTSTTERRACLTRALEINPNNARAREALRRLEGSASGGDATTRPLSELPSSALPRRNNLYLILAGIVLLVIVAGIVFSLVNANQPAPLDPSSLTGVARAGLLATERSTVVHNTATPLPTFAVVVTIDQSQNDLPATYTPTFTPTVTITPTPTETPLPLNTYALLYAGIDSGQSVPQLYRILGDGTGEGLYPVVDGGYRDISIDPGGKRFAFVRDVFDPLATAEANSETTLDVAAAHPQLFVGSVDDPNNLLQVTHLLGTQLSRPSWSPDGLQIAFASDAGGNFDIYVVAATGGGPPKALTKSEGVDKDPAWSPDGARIAYASDQKSPTFNQFAGTTEIFLINADGTGSSTQLTDAGGGSYWPSWSPDGKTIVFASDRSGDSDLYLMTDRGEGQDLITFDDQGAEDRQPVFSSDGLWIAFTSNRESSNFQAYLIDRRGNTVKRVTNNQRDVQAVTYFPD